MNLQVLALQRCSGKKAAAYAGSRTSSFNERLLLFGISESGESCCLHVANVPYFMYVNLRTRTEEEFRRALNKCFLPQHTLTFESRRFIFGYRPDSEGNPKKFVFAKITCFQFEDLITIKRFVEKINVEDDETFEAEGTVDLLPRFDDTTTRFVTYHHDSTLQFQMLLNISPLGWICASDITEEPCRARLSHCAVERDCDFSQLRRHPSLTEIAPLRLCSWDIETYSQSRAFPRSENTHDKVIAIGLTFGVYGRPGEFRKEVLSLGQSRPHPVIKISCYNTESELLTAFAAKIRDVDILFGYNNFFFDTPYLVDRARRVQYFTRREQRNLKNLKKKWTDARVRMGLYARLKRLTQEMQNPRDPEEWKPILKRFKRIYPNERFFRDTFLPSPCEEDIVLGAYSTVEDLWEAHDYFGKQPPTRFFFLSRIVSESCRAEIQPLQSASMGANILCKVNMTGRISFDLFLYIKNQFKLSSYKLNSVAKEFLSEEKVDLPYQELFDLFDAGTAAGLHRIAVYCSGDCDLPLQLVEKLNIVPPIVEQSRICKVPMQALFTRGQQVKVWNCLSYMAEQEGYVMNKIAMNRPREYTGATVLDPQPGYHERPVVTLDFASLYPSIMMSHNLCFSTWVEPCDHEQLLQLQREGLVKLLVMQAGGEQHIFVQGADGTPRRGILPRLERALLDARRQTKKLMKQESDPFKKALMDGRQLALKIVCNSAYGFCGVSTGFLPCWPIAACTCCIGRSMILDTKTSIEKKFPGSEIVYGDTDSVMIKFAGVENSEDGVRAAWKLGEQAAQFLTQEVFGKHEEIVMELEKIYHPYLLWDIKKRYAGRCFMAPDKIPKWDCKGTEIVRRDNCTFLKDLYTMCLNIIMPLEGAVQTRTVIHDQLRVAIAGYLDRTIKGAIPLRNFIISKSLSKAIYKNCNLPHVYLAQKIRRRIREQRLLKVPPQTGDRVPYVIVTGIGKLYERAEDPGYCEQHKLRLDLGYYVDKQLRKPIGQLTRYFLPEFEKMCDLTVALGSTLNNQRLDSKWNFFQRLLRIKVSPSSNNRVELKEQRLDKFVIAQTRSIKRRVKYSDDSAKKKPKRRQQQPKIDTLFRPVTVTR